MLVHQLLLHPRHHMRNPFQRSYSTEEQWVFDFLEGVKLFRSLTYEEKSFFLPYLYLRKYKQDEVVFFRGDPAHALYVIKQGEVKLMLDVDQDFEKLASMQRQQSFGNNALIPETKRLYSAIAQLSEAELYVIPHVNINSIFSEKSKIQAKMLSALADMYEHHVENLYDSYRASKGFFSLDLVDRMI